MVITYQVEEGGKTTFSYLCLIYVTLPLHIENPYNLLVGIKLVHFYSEMWLFPIAVFFQITAILASHPGMKVHKESEFLSSTRSIASMHFTMNHNYEFDL